MMTVSLAAASGSFSARKRSSPTFARPIALSIPLLASTMRHGGLPSRGSRVIDFVTIAPMAEGASTPASSLT